MTKQLNVALPAKTIIKVKTDCIKLGVSLQDYTEQAFAYFQTLNAADLRQRMGKLRKVTGRKIVAQ